MYVRIICMFVSIHARTYVFDTVSVSCNSFESFIIALWECFCEYSHCMNMMSFTYVHVCVHTCVHLCVFTSVHKLIPLFLTCYCDLMFLLLWCVQVSQSV